MLDWHNWQHDPTRLPRSHGLESLFGKTLLAANKQIELFWPNGISTPQKGIVQQGQAEHAVSFGLRGSLGSLGLVAFRLDQTRFFTQTSGGVLFRIVAGGGFPSNRETTPKDFVMFCRFEMTIFQLTSTG